MVPFGLKRREWLARTIADFTKAIFAVAGASQFLKEFTPGVRIALGVMMRVSVVTALFVQPEENT